MRENRRAGLGGVAVKNTKLAYSSETTVCRRCGKPLHTGACRSDEDAVPDKVVAKLRLEKAGRKGKGVTVVYDLPRNKDFLKALSKELKSLCGSGGKAGDGLVEVQGDQRERLREHLRGKGWQVKG